MPITPDLFTVAEAAAELGLTPASLRHAIMRGAIQVVAIDKRTNAITRAEIERYRKENLGRRFGRPPDYKPTTKAAEYARAYRERKKQRQEQQPVKTPAESE